MQIQIQSPHFDPGEQLVYEVTQKLGGLEMLYNRIEKCSVVLKHEKNDVLKGFTVEARLAVPKADLFAEESAESFERALDKVQDNLKKQIIKHKDRLKEPGHFRDKLSVEELSSE